MVDQWAAQFCDCLAAFGLEAARYADHEGDASVQDCGQFRKWPPVPEGFIATGRESFVPMNVTQGRRPRGVERDPLALHEAASRLAGQSGEELGSILRLANMGIWTADVATGTFHCSSQVSDILELDADRISNIDALAEYFLPNARVILAACIAQAVERAEAWTIELPLVTASGNSRWVRMLGAPSGGAPGERIVGAMQDITESVAAREEMDAATQRLALAVESAHIGLWDWNVAEDRF